MALNRISPLGFDLSDAALNFPSADGVNALSLAANVAETLTIPAGAVIVRLAATDNVFIKSNAVATVPGDTTDGSASELLKLQGGSETWRQLSGVTSIGVITNAAGGAILTASFYGL